MCKGFFGGKKPQTIDLAIGQGAGLCELLEEPSCLKP